MNSQFLFDGFYVNLTMNCNLNCKYCNIVKKNELMNIKTLNNTINFIKKYSEEKAIIRSFGGEPLLEFKKIKKLNDKLKNKEIVITTNGTLLNKNNLSFFKNKNITLKLSLDGEKKIHDLNRISINKNSSFNTIIKNIKNIKNKKDIIIKLTSTPNTIKYLFKNFIFLINLGFKRFEFNYVQEQKWNKKSRKEFILNLTFIGEKIFELYKKKNPINASFINNYKDYDFKDYNVCNKKNILITTKGNIYLCPSYYFLPKKFQKKLYLGNVNSIFNLNKLKKLNLEYNCKTKNEKDCKLCKKILCKKNINTNQCWPKEYYENKFKNNKFEYIKYYEYKIGKYFFNKLSNIEIFKKKDKTINTSI